MKEKAFFCRILGGAGIMLLLLTAGGADSGALELAGIIRFACVGTGMLLLSFIGSRCGRRRAARTVRVQPVRRAAEISLTPSQQALAYYALCCRAAAKRETPPRRRSAA